jgi:hypothetical protein
MNMLILALAAGLALPAAAQSPAWSVTTNGQGYGLVLAPRGGPAVLSLACVRGTSEILAIAYAVKPAPGQQELTLRFDHRRVVFVVKPQAMKDGQMVQASAKAGPDLLASIRTAKSISATYGQTELGPFPAPPEAMGRAFASRCGPLI